MNRMNSANVRKRLLGRGPSAFFHGVAHAMDLGGILAPRRGRFAQGFAGDAAALRQDWQRAMAFGAADLAETRRRDGEA